MKYLYCPFCYTEASADVGDYFMMDDSEMFRRCGHDMMLLERTDRFRPDIVIKDRFVTKGDLRA